MNLVKLQAPLAGSRQTDRTLDAMILHMVNIQVAKGLGSNSSLRRRKSPKQLSTAIIKGKILAGDGC